MALVADSGLPVFGDSIYMALSGRKRDDGSRIPLKSNQRSTMKKSILAAALMLAAGSLLAADSSSQDQITAAAAALGNQPNYSWHSAISSPSGGAGGRMAPLGFPRDNRFGPAPNGEGPESKN